MKRSILFHIFLIFCIQTLIANETINIDKIFESVGFIEPDNSKDNPFCTGFIIGKKDRIITCGHCIDEDDNNIVNLYKLTINNNFSYRKTNIIIDVDHFEYSVLKPDKSIDCTPLKFGDFSKVNEGDKIYYIGFDMSNYSMVLCDSFVQKKERIEFKDKIAIATSYLNVIKFEPSVKSGYSGGPVFNSNFEVIGIIQSTEGVETEKGFKPNFDIAISIEYLKKFFDLY